MNDTSSSGFWRSRYGLALLVFLAVIAFFLITEHTAHFLGALPYLLLAACPLMHLFMHHGHDSGAKHSKHSSTDPESRP